MEMIHAVGLPGGAELSFMSGILFLLLSPYIINIVALVDILRHEFDPHQNKLVWLLVTLFLPLIGGVLYFLIGRKSRLTKEMT